MQTALIYFYLLYRFHVDKLSSAHVYLRLNKVRKLIFVDVNLKYIYIDTVFIGTTYWRYTCCCSWLVIMSYKWSTNILSNWSIYFNILDPWRCMSTSKSQQHTGIIKNAKLGFFCFLNIYMKAFLNMLSPIIGKQDE